MTRKQHCKGCGEFSEEVCLIYVGNHTGYIEFCKQCARKLGDGKLKIARNSDGKIKVIRLEEAIA